MYVSKLADLIAPRHCGGCGLPSPDTCRECRAELAIIPPVQGPKMWCAFEYRGPVKRLIQRAKFDPGGRREFVWLADLAATRLSQAGLARPDAVIAVPLGRSRLAQRGFNQALVLARVLGAGQELPILEGLMRTRETSRQVGLDRAGRRRNMAGAFGWEGKEMPPTHLWLVDDVVTTGSTTEAAKAALLEAGALRIQVISLAREI